MIIETTSNIKDAQIVLFEFSKAVNVNYVIIVGWHVLM